MPPPTPMALYSSPLGNMGPLDPNPHPTSSAGYHHGHACQDLTLTTPTTACAPRPSSKRPPKKKSYSHIAMIVSPCALPSMSKACAIPIAPRLLTTNHKMPLITRPIWLGAHNTGKQSLAWQGTLLSLSHSHSPSKLLQTKLLLLHVLYLSIPFLAPQLWHCLHSYPCPSIPTRARPYSTSSQMNLVICL